VSFDMKKKMSRKEANADAEAMVGDFLSTALERYKYMVGADAPAKQDASAPKASGPTPQPTPAAEKK